MDIRRLAAYPFLSDAKEFVRELGIALEELLFDISFERARLFSIDRLERAFTSKDVGGRRLVTESDYLAELLSYPLSKMIVACLEDRFLLGKYALAEAVHAYKHLSGESLDFIMYVAKDLDLDVKYENDNIAVHFVDYLKFAPTRYKEWKMVNRPLNKGYVFLQYRDLVRIIQERLRRKIVEEVEKSPCIQLVKEAFNEDIARFKKISIRKKAEVQYVEKVSVAKFPPCIRSILDSIRVGENVPHMGRFALVAFLSAIGVSNEEILKIFTNAPDFDEDRARYQVEHITGKRSSTKYAPPGCEKMKTYGLCPFEKIDDLCRKVKNPVTYYWIKVKEGSK